MIDQAEVAAARERTAAASKPDWFPPEKPMHPADSPFVNPRTDPPRPPEPTAPPPKPAPENPPKGSALAEAIARRASLRGAVSRLGSRASGRDPVLAAIEAGNEDAILTGLVGLAIDEWMTANCGRPDTQLSAWSARVENDLQAAVWADPSAVPADAEPYLRELARYAETPDKHVFDGTGRPARRRPGSVSMNRIMVARS